MNNQFYIFVVDFSYVAKNKLHAAAYDYCMSFDKKAFPADKLKRFKELFLKDIEKLNQEHKRSSPIIIDFYGKYEKDPKNIIIHGIQSCNCQLIKGNLVDLAN